MAILRVHRKALSQDQVDALDSECDFSNLKILLYSTQPQLDENKEIVILEKDLPFSTDSLIEDKWLEFPNITRILATRATNNFLTLRLAMGGSCPNVSLDKFGISITQSEYQPELITYAKSENDPWASKLEKVLQRKKREAEALNINETTDTPTVESSRPTTIADYQAAKCQIHDFNVSNNLWLKFHFTEFLCELPTAILTS